MHFLCCFYVRSCRPEATRFSFKASAFLLERFVRARITSHLSQVGVSHAVSRLERTLWYQSRRHLIINCYDIVVFCSKSLRPFCPQSLSFRDSGSYTKKDLLVTAL